MKSIQPVKEDKFTFGLWTVGNRGRDPFGEATRDAIPPVTIVKRLSELGAYGVNLHDNDLISIDATPADRDRIVKEFKSALSDYGMVVPMATTNLFFDPCSRMVHSPQTILEFDCMPFRRPCLDGCRRRAWCETVRLLGRPRGHR
jgi:hypothetical protein